MPDMIPWQLQALGDRHLQLRLSAAPASSTPRRPKATAAPPIGYLIERGRFGDTDRGVRFAGLFAWRGLIHAGAGEAMLVVDEKASEDSAPRSRRSSAASTPSPARRSSTCSRT